MVIALGSGTSAPCSTPGRRRCVVFFGKTVYSHKASFHPSVYMDTSGFNAEGGPAMHWLPI